MHVLTLPLMVVYYLVLGLYVLIAACVAASCLAAVSTLLVRQAARDAIDYLTYPT
jgi:hypothetical protein